MRALPSPTMRVWGSIAAWGLNLSACSSGWAGSLGGGTMWGGSIGCCKNNHRGSSARDALRYPTRHLLESLSHLPEIERSAASLFKTHPEDLGIPDALYDALTPIDTFAQAQKHGHLWVAVDTTSEEVVGFARVSELSGFAQLDELDVLPTHARQGVGSALLSAVCAWARAALLPGVTLRTFRDVAWNGPFYMKRGFVVCDGVTLSANHVALETAERGRGLRTELRTTMIFRMTE